MGKQESPKTFDLAALEALPDFAALRQVKDALWKYGDVHGAAVMVGAGFSRFASLASATAPLPPLWNTFRDAMQHDLYPSGGGPEDPLVLAEEYRSMLGGTALDSLIRRYVRDQEWTPGDLHGKLLRLPWSDVLTTNWDTLLERAAASDVETTYDVVAVAADIARARRPRIVKLHGSLPSHLPFIFTEEDFRTYPERFAPFVNLAQQALLENELCLIGFSGEDPNFLKWAGWVRDQLGNSARPIRLIGVLNLSASRRKLFEARNITPIDLSPLVQGQPHADRHRIAAEVLLEYLWRSRPSANVEWERTPEADYAIDASASPQDRLARIVEIWRKDREAHPGWLATPYYDRYRARMDTQQDALGVLSKDLAEASPETRAAAIFEVVWRFGTMFWSLPPWLEDLIATSTSSGEDTALPTNQRVAVHAALVRLARERRDWTQFEVRAGTLQSLSGEEARSAHAYELCLRARDTLDYAYILENAKYVTGADPVWGLRRAALLAEVLEEEAAAILVFETHKEIRRRRALDRRSHWLLSREAWAHYLMGGAWFELPKDNRSEAPEDWPLTFKAARTDPWDEFQAFGDSLIEAEKRAREDARETTPLFDPGHYIARSGRTRWISGAVSSPLEQLAHLAEHVGLPLSLGADVLGQRWARAISLSDHPATAWYALRSVAAHDYDVLEHRFSRLAVATMPQLDVEAMIERLMNAIQVGADQMARKGGKIGDWASRLTKLCDVLSRLCLRASGETAIACFRLGAGLFSNPNLRHWWILKGVGALLRRSLEALEPERRRELALEVLRLPLPSEVDFGGIESDFPDASVLLSAEDWKAREDSRAADPSAWTVGRKCLPREGQP